MKRRHVKTAWIAALIVMMAFTLLPSQSTVTSHAAVASPFDSFRTEAENAATDKPKSPFESAGEEAAGGHSGSSAIPTLPDNAVFAAVAENNRLRLKADRSTGHFVLENKQTGNSLYSYPAPEYWEKETSQGTWLANLVSPIVLQYVDPKRKNDLPRSTSFIEKAGTVEEFETIDDGFRLGFRIDALELFIPVEVRLLEDGVETTVVADGIQEGAFSLTTMQLYPFLGASGSTGQDGYLLVPDGAGALIRFKEHRLKSNYNYESNVYGVDWAVRSTSFTRSRSQISAPIFGIKSGSQGLLAVLHEGDAYSKVKASPSQHLTQYNMATFELVFRESYWQPTTTNERLKATQGYNVYPEKRYEGNRVVRYYVLDDEQADYVGMAVRYREYLMEEQDLAPIKAERDIPLYLDILGADIERGFFFNRYRKATDTAQAEQILERMLELGVKNMSLRYLGWQKGGYSVFGEYGSADRRIGGDSGVRQLIETAHGYNIPVHLFAVYEWNNNKGFSGRKNGMVDQGNTIIKFRHDLLDTSQVMVSPRHAVEQMRRDLPKLKELGADGISFNNIGRFLNSDFKRDYPLSRKEALELQQAMFRESQETLGLSSGEQSNAYIAPYVNHIYDMSEDYSYDVFADESVPFLQIALHGLVSYSFEPANQREQFVQEFLRGIEFGAVPYFVFSGVPANELKNTFEFSFFWNSYYKDWEDVVEREYRRYNEALGDVQDQFIIGHRSLAEQVREVSYSNGKRIIVNYGETAYKSGMLEVPPRDFIAVKGEPSS